MEGTKQRIKLVRQARDAYQNQEVRLIIKMKTEL